MNFEESSSTAKWIAPHPSCDLVAFLEDYFRECFVEREHLYELLGVDEAGLCHIISGLNDAHSATT